MLAKVKYLQGKTNQAEAFLNDAISEYPKNIRAYRTLYKYYVAQKQSDKAKNILTRGLQAAPSSIELKMLLAEAYKAEGENDKAIQLFQEVVEDQPNFDVARNNLAVLLTTKGGNQLVDAEALVQHFRSSDIPQYQDTLGWIYYQQGRFLDAIYLLEKAVDGLPNFGEIKYHLGMAYIGAGRHQEGEKYLQLALQTNQRFSGRDHAENTLKNLTKE